MLKIGVAGTGHLGKFHLNCIKNISEYQLLGIFDLDTERALEISKQYECKAFDSLDELIDAVDVLVIVTPTLSHYSIAEKALQKRKHLFIEKPVTHTLQEAYALQKLAQEAGVKVQVGHVERFNPAFVAVESYIKNPMFIEAHRLAEFNPRGTDVPVVLDLMIHDIDVLLSITQSQVKKISASGVCVLSDTPDITNARIEFDNGCVANLTASRISMKKMRKTRVFQKNAYISIDFLSKESEIISMKNVDGTPENPYALLLENNKGEKKEVIFNKPQIHLTNAIEEELKALAHSINNNSEEAVTLEDGVQSLEVAHKILDIVAVNTSRSTI